MSRTAIRRHHGRSRISPQAERQVWRSRLTPRENDVVRLIANGYYNGEIAEILSISTTTVESHRANVYNKLGIRRMASLVAYAVKANLVSV